MLVLDTNIISELVRAQPAGTVIDWLDAQEPESVWITSITVLEIRFGLELLDGKRRRLRLEHRPGVRPASARLHVGPGAASS